jgi:predicted RNase H-like HicB family nuclease
MRQVILYPDETSKWVAECLSLPGCISQGATREEALENIGAAIRLYVSCLEEDGEEVPEDRFEAIVVAV